MEISGGVQARVAGTASIPVSVVLDSGMNSSSHSYKQWTNNLILIYQIGIFCWMQYNTSFASTLDHNALLSEFTFKEIINAILSEFTLKEIMNTPTEKLPS